MQYDLYVTAVYFKRLSAENDYNTKLYWILVTVIAIEGDYKL